MIKITIFLAFICGGIATYYGFKTLRTKDDIDGIVHLVFILIAFSAALIMILISKLI
jgi:hypothetical protein